MTFSRLSDMTGVCLLALGLSAALYADQEEAKTTVPAYTPRPANVPTDASYVLPDGTIMVVADEALEGLLTKLNRLFAETHPGFRFELRLGGAATGLDGLSAGVSPFALMARAAWPLEVRPFRQVYGYEPTDIHIGRSGYAAPGRKAPPAIYVNVRNPLAGLTVEQAARVFTTGGGRGDLARWGQLGLAAPWVNRVIHVYGPRDDGGFATAMRQYRMGGFPFTRRYEPLPEATDVLRAVAEDPYGIGLVGPHRHGEFPPEVRMLPLARTEGAPYSTARYDEVLAGAYPYAPYLRLYVRWPPEQPLDAFVAEYARLALSKQGQTVIAAEGFVPLNVVELLEQLSRLERLPGPGPSR